MVSGAAVEKKKKKKRSNGLCARTMHLVKYTLLCPILEQAVSSTEYMFNKYVNRDNAVLIFMGEFQYIQKSQSVFIL